MATYVENQKRKLMRALGGYLGIGGGFLVGLGLGIIVISRVIINEFLSVDSNLSFKLENYGDIQLNGAASIIIGILLSLLGLYLINRHSDIEIPPPP